MDPGQKLMTYHMGPTRTSESMIAGAGHRNALFGTPEVFVISVSVGTAIHPVTNTDALKGLVAKATGPQKVELQKALDGLAVKKQ